MKRALAIVACLLLPGIANANVLCDPGPPPARYDRGPFWAGLKPIVERVSLAKVALECQSVKRRASGALLGCAVFVGDQCHVFIRDDIGIGACYAYVERHEFGHCRGWHEDHPP